MAADTVVSPTAASSSALTNGTRAADVAPPSRSAPPTVVWSTAIASTPRLLVLLLPLLILLLLLPLLPLLPLLLVLPLLPLLLLPLLLLQQQRVERNVGEQQLETLPCMLFYLRFCLGTALVVWQRKFQQKTLG